MAILKKDKTNTGISNDTIKAMQKEIKSCGKFIDDRNKLAEGITQHQAQLVAMKQAQEDMFDFDREKEIIALESIITRAQSNLNKRNSEHQKHRDTQTQLNQIFTKLIYDETTNNAELESKFHDAQSKFEDAMQAYNDYQEQLIALKQSFINTANANGYVGIDPAGFNLDYYTEQYISKMNLTPRTKLEINKLISGAVWYKD